MNALAALLDQGLAELDIELSAAASRLMLRYLELLEQWNNIFNLTAVRTPKAMLKLHLLDSLTLLPYLKAKHPVDIGTGAGLPGLILAIARPDQQWTLLDKAAKKTRFCTQAIAELGIRNAQVVHCRAEDYRPKPCHDAAVTRALMDLASQSALAAMFCEPGARLYAMKGRYPKTELEGMEQRFNADIVSLHVPGFSAQRHLVMIDLGQPGNHQHD